MSRRLLAVVVAVVLAAFVPAAPAIGQDTGATSGPGYDFENLHALASGVSASFDLIGFLPIENLVGLSSVTSESHFGAGRSDSLAALPDPGDLILTLPGTLSALLGISGLPNYPAAASADENGTPVDDVQLVPDANLGAGHLHADADATGSSASAFVGDQENTIGLLPSFSIGSIKTTAATHQLNPTTLESVATTTVSDVKLLGGLVQIGQITSQVTAGIQNDTPTSSVDDLQVSGATLAGMPVGITDKGITGLGSSVALAPVIDKLLAPLQAQGITIKTTPASHTVNGRTATATAGTLQITAKLSVEGYPGTFTLTIGQSLAEMTVGALSDSSATAAGGTSDLGGSAGLVTGDTSSGLPGLGDNSSSLLPSLATPAPPTAGGRAPGTEIVSVPANRAVQRWSVTNLYRMMLLGGLLLFAAGQVVVRTTLRPRRRPNDLRQLWRW